jgi:hypothetical protein
MKFMIAVAIYTVHATFTEMDIASETFVLPQVFVAHAATMTGRTRAGHRWRGGEYMPIKETASHAGWLGHMAIATGGMAIRAVIPEGFLQSGMIFRYTASIQGGPVTLQ